MRDARAFYLVQRMHLSPYGKHEQAFPDAKVKSNPFGYGRMGDYELDYMGAAEFEFGTIPEANNRLAKAKRDLVLVEHEYKGHALEFLYIGKEGDPYDDFTAWAEGDKYDPPFYGKETPHELRSRLGGEEPPPYNGGEWRTHLWWALAANVIFAFKEDGHMTRWLTSMGSAPTEFLR